jgi:hypothetical protein
MDRASTLVLGFAMRADVKIIKNPDRFIDPRGAETWKTIMQLMIMENGEGLEKTHCTNFAQSAEPKGRIH